MTKIILAQELLGEGVSKSHIAKRLSVYRRTIIRWSQAIEEHGRPPYDPTLVLKMLFVSYLYNLSERQTEIYVNKNGPAKYFVGLTIDIPAPDHSTLTFFKK